MSKVSLQFDDYSQQSNMVGGIFSSNKKRGKNRKNL